MKKQLQWQQEGRPFLLAVEDPQQPGTDIGAGSFNIREVGWSIWAIMHIEDLLKLT